MKNTRKFGKMALSFLLCCALLNFTAFAAEPEVVQVGDVTIMSGITPTGIMPLAEMHVFFDGSGSCTFSNAYPISGTCRSVNGDYLKVVITNTGDADLAIKFSVTVDGDTGAVNEILTTEEGVYETSAFKQDGTGLDCTFKIDVTSNERGKTGIFKAYIVQYWR